MFVIFNFLHIILPWNFFVEVCLINMGVSNARPLFYLGTRETYVVVRKGQPWWSTPWKRCLEKKALKLSTLSIYSMDHECTG